MPSATTCSVATVASVYRSEVIKELLKRTLLPFQGFEDRSPDPNLPGRICEPVTIPPPKGTKNIECFETNNVAVHPCQDPNLNDCSYLGTCKSIPGNDDSYTCECPEGYADKSPDPINRPGRACVQSAPVELQRSCINTLCTVTPVCLDSSQNDCHQFAICQPTNDQRKFTCRCRDGYSDESPDRNRPGRVCRPR